MAPPAHASTPVSPASSVQASARRRAALGSAGEERAGRAGDWRLGEILDTAADSTQVLDESNN